MKTIVCYGDSNTWGAKPEINEPLFNDEMRHAPNVRWPGVLRELLGDGYLIEEEGLNGRTTILDDPLDGRRNGLNAINTVMFTNMPADLVIIMLGTNDTKEHLNATPHIIATGIELLANEIIKGGYGHKNEPPEIMIVAPPHIRDNIDRTWLAGEMGAGCIEKDRALASEYKKIATRIGCRFFDASLYAELSENDGLHMDAENHRKFAEAIVPEIRDIFSE